MKSMAEDATLVLLAVCESCWLVDHAHWEPDSMDDTGNIMMRLKGVDIPENTSLGSVEICCLCGGITVCGIYQLMSPDDTYFSDSESPKFELEIQDFGDDYL